MDVYSQETLQRIEQNDAKLTTLIIGDVYVDESRGDHCPSSFVSSNTSDYSKLGAAIGKNTRLTHVILHFGITNSGFIEGIKKNSSVTYVLFNYAVQHEMLDSYHQILNQPIRIGISFPDLLNGGHNTIANILRRYSSIRNLSFGDNIDISHEQLLTIIEAIREHNSLESLHLSRNNIGNDGCRVIATLLEDPNNKLRTLNLSNNNISNEGATVIANSLANNTKLIQLNFGSGLIIYYLGVEANPNRNPIDQRVVDVFRRLICNTSSIGSTYSSNHTLFALNLPLPEIQLVQQLDPLLKLNEDTNKSHVAIKKILKFHPNLDMEPLFDWDADQEQTLKALPYAIEWFGRAGDAVADIEEGENYHIENRKLSSIFQFTKAMPLLLDGVKTMRLDDNDGSP